MSEPLYLWRTSKASRRVHILDSETRRTFCQAENCSGGKAFDSRGPRIPDGRRLCQNCADLASRDKADYQEPRLAVLMGERLAETEPELFAGTVGSKPWKRAKQARAAHKPRGRKAQRSNVKYARPFNDDLPW